MITFKNHYRAGKESARNSDSAGRRRIHAAPVVRKIRAGLIEQQVGMLFVWSMCSVRSLVATTVVSDLPLYRRA